jgi:hypothetical protein
VDFLQRRGNPDAIDVVSIFDPEFRSPPFCYQWRLNSTNVSGATNASLTPASVETSQSGDYTVVVSNPAGGITSQVATLTVRFPLAITTQPQSQVAIQRLRAVELSMVF